ncbi:CYTH domain-containing protein [Alteromonas halophila]|uniref:Inorganic triphosphatase n=1 Tax=Alteromonas halophila TaxID=516698 RepID=A0A918JK69_9ALTE|nr:CYTH domain-containing protein [Alteromonas halophila]GGW79969.1 inorganic triphosphatase [Alteromonas halophila]
MAEIELKFVTGQNVRQAFNDKVLPALREQGIEVDAGREMQLRNDYYDTPDHDFQKHKIGFRVRGNNGQFEQTLKTNGKVSGGLHHRAEFNVPLTEPSPDLSLFDSDVWPEELNPSQLSGQLEQQFSTHFTRTAFDASLNGSRVEIVLDEGIASTDKASSPIHEIELELLEGEVSALYTLADIINAKLDVRLSDTSKAAQGYELLHGLPSRIEPLPEFLPLKRDCTTEDAFAAAVSMAMRHWQYHEHLYLQGGSVKALGEVVTAIRLLMQSVSLYLPVLQCPDMLTLHKQLITHAQAWLWQDELQSLRYLLSKKSLFAKMLGRHGDMLSYLQGRRAGLLKTHEPDTLFYQSDATAIKLKASYLLQMRPWRSQAQGEGMPVMEHAKGWLSQGWQTVQQSMPANRAMGAANYSAVEVLLRQSLWNGFLVGDLFREERGDFRAPWLDLLTGIDELNALLTLKKALTDAELDGYAELKQWSDEKAATLLKVMERTRQVAMQREIYW